MVLFAEPGGFGVISEFMVLHFEGVVVDEETELLEDGAEDGVVEEGGEVVEVTLFGQ
jgi:hypothetical protein